MRLLHTSDWHLGHVLHDHARSGEHAAFLAWLRGQFVSEEIDALLVAGDIFDTANPTAEAQAQWYQFVAGAKRDRPELEIVVIGGNHDSPARLDAPDPLFRALGVRVVGGLSHRDDLGRCLVPMSKGGKVRAWVAAVPFLRPADLPPVAEAEGADRLVEGVRQLYARVLREGRAQRRSGQALLAMGHAYLAGTQLSELSERRILGGNQHALPADIFPDDLAYVALGHLHRAQRVAGREAVRYSGSPLPLALNEAGYVHQVVVAELEGEGLGAVKTIPVPREAEILRLPAAGAGLPDAVLEAAARLPALEPGMAEHRRPFLEVVVRFERPEPGFRRRLEEALENKAPRLAKITPEMAGDGQRLADRVAVASLRDLQPEEVFVHEHQRVHGRPPEPELLAAFHELLAAAQTGAGE